MLYQKLVRDDKLREVSVSSFFKLIIDAVAKETLVNKYCTKASQFGETQSSHCQRITHFPEE